MLEKIYELFVGINETVRNIRVHLRIKRVSVERVPTVQAPISSPGVLRLFVSGWSPGETLG